MTTLKSDPDQDQDSDSDSDPDQSSDPYIPPPCSLRDSSIRTDLVSSPSSPVSPQRYPDCCLGISSKLLSILNSEILPVPNANLYTDASTRHPPSSRILSIGSGSGLLERLLQLSHPAATTSLDTPVRCCCNDGRPGIGRNQGQGPVPDRELLPIFGVEVSDTVNKYLPISNMIVVHGTWDIAAEAAEAAALLFVYPRQVGLMRRYLDRHAKGRAWTRAAESAADGKVGTVVWLGPVVDWEEGGFGVMVKEWVERQGGLLVERRGVGMGLPQEEMGVVVSRLR